MNIPNGLYLIRREICKKCLTPCVQQHNMNHYGDKCSICPLPSPKWRQYGRCMYGLGDLVSSVAQPIARASDAIFKTNLVGCEPCAKRREALNKFIPDLGITPSEKP